MMVETMEHEFIEPERKEDLQYLRQNYDGKRILIDMGTEAPLVYDSGLDVKEFVYNEGGESLWHEACAIPRSGRVAMLRKAMQYGNVCRVTPIGLAGILSCLKTEHYSPLQAETVMIIQIRDFGIRDSGRFQYSRNFSNLESMIGAFE